MITRMEYVSREMVEAGRDALRKAADDGLNADQTVIAIYAAMRLGDPLPNVEGLIPEDYDFEQTI